MYEKVIQLPVDAKVNEIKQSIKTIKAINDLTSNSLIGIPYSFSYLTADFVTRLFDNRSQIKLNEQLELCGQIMDVFPNAKSLMESRIKKYYVDEASLNDETTV